MTTAYVLVGAPAVGKSTTARALCALHPRSIHIPVDDLRLMVVSGRVLPSDDWSEELAQQVTLARGTALEMAARYRAAGFTVVVDDFLDPRLLGEYRCLDGDPGAVRVVLRPAQDEAHRRNQLARHGWRFLDTTALDVEQTVREVTAGRAAH